MPMAFLPRWGWTDNEVFPFRAPPPKGEARMRERMGVKELPADIYIFVQGESDVYLVCLNLFKEVALMLKC